MFLAKLNFQQILQWFNNSEYKNLIMFLPSLNPEDSFLEEHIIDNQFYIDRFSGCHTSFIYIDNSLEELSIKSVRVHNIPKNSIRYGDDVVDEISNIYDIPKRKLPALFVLSKYHGHRIYKIESKKQLDSLFTPIAILSCYIDDKKKLEKKLKSCHLTGNDYAHDSEEMKINHELEEVELYYTKKLESATLVEDASRFLFSVHSPSGCILDLLDETYSRLSDIDVAWEALNKQIQEQKFDTFISCKSEDYESATELYDFLKGHGLRPRENV